ncbi:MAG TPA: FkbM family methyltransferase [Panacibacter sp.]|nr:FkbM family methyltransferase [Panacibacter sp.]
MGIYEKIGIRKVALKITEYINWVRLYKYKDGVMLYRSLQKPKNSFFSVNASFFKAPVKLRDNYSDRAIFMQVFFEKQYELFDATMPDSKTIIDAGANIGLASIYFSLLFPKATIISIEPEESNFVLLKENTKAYPNIECIKAGIWHKNEPIYITNPETLAAGFMVEKDSNKNDVVMLNGITINSILELKKWSSIDILKMDIEGAEKEVFSAIDIYWLSKVKLLIIELHDRYKEGTTKALFKAIDQFEYKAYFHHENIFIFLKEKQ